MKLFEQIYKLDTIQMVIVLYRTLSSILISHIRFSTLGLT